MNALYHVAKVIKQCILWNIHGINQETNML